MSHEFRTPLGSILSITRLLSDELDGPLSPEQHTQVRFVSSAASELSEMVDDLLDLAKIEAGRVSISPAWFDMLDLFSALRGMFRPIVEGSPIDLIFEEPEGIPRLYTDDKKLAQILRNFISNAVKFTPQGWCACRHGWKTRSRSASPSATPVSALPRAARPAFRRFRPGRLAAAEAPARHRPRPGVVQAFRRTARRPCRCGKRTRQGLGVLCSSASGD